MANDYYKPVSDSPQQVQSTDHQKQTDDEVAPEVSADVVSKEETQPATEAEPEKTKVEAAPQESVVAKADYSASSQSNKDDTSNEAETKKFIDEQIEAMIDDLGLKGATDEQKKKILETIDERVMTAVTKTLIEKATDEQATKIKETIEANGPIEEVVEKIITDNPDLKDEIEEAMADLYNKIKSESDQIFGEHQEVRQVVVEPKVAEPAAATAEIKPEPTDEAEVTAKPEAKETPIVEPTPSNEAEQAGTPVDMPTTDEPVQAAAAQSTTPEANKPASSTQAAGHEIVDSRAVIKAVLASGEQVTQSSAASQVYNVRSEQGIKVPEIEAIQNENERQSHYQNWDWDTAEQIVEKFKSDTL